MDHLIFKEGLDVLSDDSRLDPRLIAALNIEVCLLQVQIDSQLGESDDSRPDPRFPRFLDF